MAISSWAESKIVCVCPLLPSHFLPPNTKYILLFHEENFYRWQPKRLLVYQDSVFFVNEVRVFYKDKRYHISIQHFVKFASYWPFNVVINFAFMDSL